MFKMQMLATTAIQGSMAAWRLEQVRVIAATAPIVRGK